MSVYLALLVTFLAMATVATTLGYVSLRQLGKGSKIKLIIFAEFSANGGGEVPPIRENN